ncbi:uncharacterized protein LOC114146522 isoform X2 [Xiphophorus couchianus]|nr:uncharacterized protein LOC114146522 isoform X2 [Xiphophorus couchianus]
MSLFPVTQLSAGPSDLMTRRQSLTMDSRFVFFFFTSALVAAAAVTASLSGSTAQCKIKWLFGIDCGNVSGRLVDQIQSWQVKGSCLDEGEKCSYQLVSSAPYLIKATHTSPRTKTLNILQFLLEQSTVCRVTGEATSEGSKDPADNATNFCSLQNLVNGSKLTDAEGYKQFSNKWICPGFDSAVCSFS